MEDERQEAIAWMRDFANKLVKGLEVVRVYDVRYFDKYQGAIAYLAFSNDLVVKVSIASEDDDIFVEHFAISNNKPDENPGWFGSVSQFRDLIKSDLFRRLYIKTAFRGEWVKR